MQQLKNNEENDDRENTRISGEGAPADNPLQRIESLQHLTSISSLANILQSSSANVLNVDFWRNTFNLKYAISKVLILDYDFFCDKE